MSFFNTTVAGYDGITAQYRPEREREHCVTPAGVLIELSGANAYLHLGIEDARTLAEALPGVLAEHDAVVSALTDKAA
ncbi:hypothetical protein [Nocardia brasiliensis]|uniref:hypothetical protein n=1 Tax=Nocardia brasiliensis TaxID=37326 RepID=UPI0024563A6F|nr:hypothetical protein [Nocardia brasiliensis]